MANFLFVTGILVFTASALVAIHFSDRMVMWLDRRKLRKTLERRRRKEAHAYRTDRRI